MILIYTVYMLAIAGETFLDLVKSKANINMNLCKFTEVESGCLLQWSLIFAKAKLVALNRALLARNSVDQVTALF